jgi:hypothetical protein
MDRAVDFSRCADGVVVGAFSFHADYYESDEWYNGCD